MLISFIANENILNVNKNPIDKTPFIKTENTMSLHIILEISFFNLNNQNEKLNNFNFIFFLSLVFYVLINVLHESFTHA